MPEKLPMPALSTEEAAILDQAGAILKKEGMPQLIISTNPVYGESIMTLLYIPTKGAHSPTVNASAPTMSEALMLAAREYDEWKLEDQPIRSAPDAIAAVREAAEKAGVELGDILDGIKVA